MNNRKGSVLCSPCYEAGAGFEEDEGASAHGEESNMSLGSFNGASAVVLYLGVGWESSSGERIPKEGGAALCSVSIESEARISGSSYDERSGDGDGGKGGKISRDVGRDLMAISDAERAWALEKLGDIM